MIPVLNVLFAVVHGMVESSVKHEIPWATTDGSAWNRTPSAVDMTATVARLAEI